jgi:hypothetical protein
MTGKFELFIDENLCFRFRLKALTEQWWPFPGLFRTSRVLSPVSVRSASMPEWA